MFHSSSPALCGRCAGGKWRDREEKMVPGGLTKWNTSPAVRQGSSSASHLGKFSYCHGEKRTCTHPETHRMNPFFGKAGYRKLTWAQELANPFCHIRTVPAAPVTTHTPPNRLGLEGLPARRLHVWFFPWEPVVVLGRKERLISEGNPNEWKGRAAFVFSSPAPTTLTSGVSHFGVKKFYSR